VQGLGADHDRVEAEVVRSRVPAALVDAAEEPEQPQRVEVAAPRDAVLAVGGEDEVLRRERAAGADLCGLLTEQLRPDAELAVTLQRGGLDVDAAGEHHVAVEALDRLVVEVEAEVGMLDALAFGRQQLHELRATVGVRGAEDLTEVGAEVGCAVVHVHSSTWSAGGVSAAGRSSGPRRDVRGVVRSDRAEADPGRVTGDTPVSVLIKYRSFPCSPNPVAAAGEVATGSAPDRISTGS
jgi:hypothetical protein